MVPVFLFTLSALGGGGPANVLVLANAEDPSALDLADHYATQRALPPGALCEVSNIDAASDSIDLEAYRTDVLGALNACLDAHPQQEEIDYIVVLRGLPYRVDLPTGFTVSLSAMLQISNTTHISTGEALAGQPISTWGGVQQASFANPWYVGSSSTEAFDLSNPYMAHYSTAVTIAGTDRQPHAPRRQDAPLSYQWQYTDNLFVVSRLDGFDYADARALVDRGVASDGTFPDAPITCMAAADSARGARDPECAYAIDLLADAGLSAQYIDIHDATLSDEHLAGFMTGTTSFEGGIDGNTWVPGAFAGNLTSYGAVPGNFRCSEDGRCPASESQTSIARFVRGGATFAHGTANEPLNNTFPGAGLFLLATMGYGPIEAALMTQRYLYWQNIYLGDPLAAPWAERPVVAVDPDAPVNQPLSITATHPAGIAEVRLYVDGVRVDERAPLADSLGLEEGDEIEVLAVAVAENARAHRAGWPQPEQQPRPDIQGWTAQRLVLAAPAEGATSADTGHLDGSDEYVPPKLRDADHTSCATTGRRRLPLLLCGLTLILLAHRRRSHPLASHP